MPCLENLLTFIACFCLGAADLAINTETPVNSCLKLNPKILANTSHVIDNITLYKCCQLGWHLNLSVILETGGVPCVEGDQNVVIEMVLLLDNKTMFYEPLQVKNYSVHISTLFKSRIVRFFDTDGMVVLDQHGVLGEIDEDCSTIVRHEQSCVDYDAERGLLVGLWKYTYFNSEIYILVPCMSTSIACLIIVIFVYLWFPELSNLTGKALAGLCCCLLAMYLCFILQYSDAFDDIRTIEKMEDISYLSCGIWFVLMWGNVCANAWYYLPRNTKMGRRKERWIFLGTVGLCVVFFITMSAVANFTDQFPSQFVLLIVILVILVACIGICLACWWGFHCLEKMQTLAFYASQQLQDHPENRARTPTYNSDDIYKCRTMCTCTSYILFYAVLCYCLKCIRQSVPEVYELFNALAGFFVFLAFVCWRRTRKIIEIFWRRQVTEDVNVANLTEMVPMTNEIV